MDHLCTNVHSSTITSVFEGVLVRQREALGFTSVLCFQNVKRVHQ